MKKPSKQMTLEDLAAMVARGFERVDARFENMATKEEMTRGFAEVEKSINKVRLDILDVGDRFVTKHQFDQLVTRFTVLEAKVKHKSK